YLPALLTYARQLLGDKKYDEAYAKIEQAKNIDSEYAPIYMTEAEWLIAVEPQAIKEQAALYKKAYNMETDYMEKAGNSGVIRTFYYNHALLPEALETADEYVENGSTVSTYLRDRKEAAMAFSAWQRALRGDKKQLKTLAHLVSQRPHNYTMRVQYAEALLANQKFDKVVEVLLSSYENLQASRVNRTDFELLLAEAYEGIGEKNKMQVYLDKMLKKDIDKLGLNTLNVLRLSSLLIRQDEVDKALAYINNVNTENSNLIQSSLSLIKAQVALQQGKESDAIKLLENSLIKNPYQLVALKLLREIGDNNSKA